MNVKRSITVTNKLIGPYHLVSRTLRDNGVYTFCNIQVVDWFAPAVLWPHDSVPFERKICEECRKNHAIYSKGSV